METCFNCGVDEEEVRLIDGVYGNEMVSVCENCAEKIDIPVIRKPSIFQLRDVNSSKSVKDRLSKMAGIEKEKEISLDDLRKKKFDLKENDIRKRNEPLNLIDNFHWYIQNARRKSKLEVIQLAEILGENEFIIKELEKGNLPDDAYLLLRKIEQYFHIKLIIGEEPKKEVEKFDWKRREEIKEKWGREEEERVREKLEDVEEGIQVLGLDEEYSFGKKEDSVKEDKFSPENIEKAGIVGADKKLKFDSQTLKSLTIADLQRMKTEKENIEKKGENVDFVELKEEPEHLKGQFSIGGDMKKRAEEKAKVFQGKKEFYY